MVDVKISALSAISAVAAEDLIAIIDDPSGTPASRKATFTQILAFIDANSAALSNIVEDTSPDLGGTLTGSGFDQTGMGTISMTEQAAANADVAGDGQIWVKTATPNQLWFTDDAGTDFQLASIAGTETFINKTIDADGTGNSITNIENADIKAAAAIAYSKLNLTGNVVDGDLAGSIAQSKITNLTTDLGNKSPLASPTFTGTVTTATVDVAGNNIDNIQKLIHDLETITSSTAITVNFNNEDLAKLALAHDTTFSSSNLAVGKTKEIHITSSSAQTMDFPEGWTFYGTKPTTTSAGKDSVLQLTSIGSTDADVKAVFVEEE